MIYIWAQRGYEHKTVRIFASCFPDPINRTSRHTERLRHTSFHTTVKFSEFLSQKLSERSQCTVHKEQVSFARSGHLTRSALPPPPSTPPSLTLQPPRAPRCAAPRLAPHRLLRRCLGRASMHSHEECRSSRNRSTSHPDGLSCSGSSAGCTSAPNPAPRTLSSEIHSCNIAMPPTRLPCRGPPPAPGRPPLRPSSSPPLRGPR